MMQNFKYSIHHIQNNIDLNFIPQTHSDKECEFSKVQCIHTGCDERYQRRAQKHHEEICSFKRIACQHCDKMIKVLTAEVANIKTHHQI